MPGWFIGYQSAPRGVLSTLPPKVPRGEPGYPSRLVDLSEPADRELRPDRHVDTRVERAGSHSPTDPLFVRRLNGASVPFNLLAMAGLVAGWYRRADVIPPPGSLAHALRLTDATLLVDAGASLPEVQRLLGHADLSTTQVYLKVTRRGLEEALSNPARALLRRPKGS